MGEHPKISIITPSFNQGNYIEECIDSVLSQNYTNLEYIIIDGASTDNSIEVIKKYEKYLKHWCSEPDRGQSDAVNKGLRIAKGEIFNWLNADDYYYPQALHKVANAFQNPDIQVVGGKSRVFNTALQTSHFSKGTDIYPDNLAKTIGWARIDQPETFFRISAIQKMGKLNPKLHYLMDRDWWVRYLLIFGLQGIEKIEDVLVNFRLHSDSKTISQYENHLVERDNYYLRMAQQFDFQDYADFLTNHSEAKSETVIEELVFPTDDKNLMNLALNYFMLLRAEELYAQYQFQKAQVFMDFVQPKQLAHKDYKLWRKIDFRNRYVPKPVIRLFRKLRWNY
jgi:glycosyltransferase involved in cell wall biosynthesis